MQPLAVCRRCERPRHSQPHMLTRHTTTTTHWPDLFVMQRKFSGASCSVRPCSVRTQVQVGSARGTAVLTGRRMHAPMAWALVRSALQGGGSRALSFSRARRRLCSGSPTLSRSLSVCLCALSLRALSSACYLCCRGCRSARRFGRDCSPRVVGGRSASCPELRRAAAPRRGGGRAASHRRGTLSRGGRGTASARA